jgi:hypothetical protein
MPWNKMYSFHIGGVTDIGFDELGLFLQVSSHSGRGLFSLGSGEQIARDNDSTYTWHHDTKVDGIGPLTGSQVQVYGIWSEMTSETKKEIASFDIDSHITEFKGTALSGDGQLLSIAYSDEVQVFMRCST